MYPTRLPPISIEDLRRPVSMRRKISESDADEIRQHAAQGETQRSIARQFGITQAAVWAILRLPPPRTPEDRFWAFVQKTDDNCWTWTGACRSGYGNLSVNDLAYSAHLVSWLLAGNPYPRDGEMLLHSCDNRPCVNPAHLRVGTAWENAQDAVLRHRFRHHRGPDHFRSRLSWEDVRDIRRLAKEGARKEDIAARFGYSVSSIWDIVLYRTWRDDPVIHVENVR